MSDQPREIELQLPTAHSRKQELIMRAFSFPEVTETFVACGTKFGKAYSYHTLTPTPDRGYIPVKDIKAGDYVFDEHGKPTRVVYATDLMYDHDCYEVTFSDGTRVISDAEHDWVTTTHAERKNMARALPPNDRCKGTKASPTKRNTLELFQTQTVFVGGKSRPNHAVANVSGPVEFEGRELPIAPYTFGVWLGGGSSNGGLITKPDTEIFDHVAQEGFVVSSQVSSGKHMQWRVQGLTALLKVNALYRNKHIPKAYLTASVADRIALLQGLMDTDGTVDKRGNCSFDNTNKGIADAVAILAQSLGIKTHRSERIGRLNGVDKKLCYRVWFTTDFPVFRLKRKLARLGPMSLKSKQRTVISVEKVASVPVMCLQVENPSHLFLVTEACIPTHNSIGGSTCMTHAAMAKRGARWRWLAPIYRQAKVGMEYFEKMVPPAPHSEFLDTKMLIKLPLLQASIEFMHTQNPTDLEGPGIDGQIGDEAAKMPYEAYVSAKTTTTRTRGPNMWLSTPYGKNWFYKKFVEAKEEMEWCIKHGKNPTRLAIHARTIDNPLISADVIAQARRDFPDRLFRQYYLAEFCDSGSTFLGVRECVRGPELEFLGGGTAIWVHEDAKTIDVVIGVDWAKQRDYAVFYAIDLNSSPRKTVGFMRFHGISYVQAVKELYQFCNRFKSVGAIWHDKTGVGEALDDMLAQFPMPFHGFHFSNSSKASIVNGLGLTLEKQDIELPNWPTLLSELDSYEVSVSPSGLMTYNAASGSHDDTVIALALANAAASEYAIGSIDIRFLEDLPKDKALQGLDRYYNDLLIDSDRDSPF